MRQKEFKEWLQIKFPETSTTVNNRIANCKNVEKYYEDLDKHYTKDKCLSIIEDLTYSTDDERQNKQPKHRIPINGNIRTGSATLKQAVKLYIEFCEFIQEENTPYIKSSINVDDKINEENPILKELLKHIDNFPYDKKAHKDISVLHLNISDYLNENYTKFKWETEYKPSELYKDSIDIIGLPKESNYTIIIELDAHRADQVAKKYLSRIALSMNENIIYLALCYPGTKKMSKNECLKYFDYCSVIANNLSKNTNIKKIFAGRIIKP